MCAYARKLLILFMISPGQKPDLSFSISYVENGQTKTELFQNLLNGPAVVTVHLKNGSPSCDQQTDSQVRSFDEIRSKGYRLIGLSQNTCASHEKFAVKKNIPYPLVSDPDAMFAKATNSIVEKKMYGKTYEAPARIAVILDKEGIVEAVLDDVTAKDFGPAILSKLSELHST